MSGGHLQARWKMRASRWLEWALRRVLVAFQAIRTMRVLFKTILLALGVAALMGRAGMAAETPIRILALGDSLTQGYGLPPGTDYPAVLEQALKAQGLSVVIVNGG